MGRFSKFKTVAIAFAIAAALAVPIAIAQSTETGPGVKKEQRGHRRGFGARGEGMRGFRNLDLTDAQKTQLKQMRETHRQSLGPLMTEIRTKRQEIRQSSQGGTFDEALVRQKLIEIAPLEAKLMAERRRLHQEMLSVLTPDQKAKVEQFKSRRSERRTRNR